MKDILGVSTFPQLYYLSQPHLFISGALLLLEYITVQIFCKVFCTTKFDEISFMNKNKPINIDFSYIF